MHDGFKYTLNMRGREGQCYWRCADHMYLGRAITSEKDELLSTLDPPEVKTDFELALVQSIRISFQNTSFRGYYYHFSQAKVQSIGLQQELMAGGALRSVPPKQRTKERRIKKIQEKFDNGDYTLANYLGAFG